MDNTALKVMLLVPRMLGAAVLLAIDAVRAAAYSLNLHDGRPCWMGQALLPDYHFVTLDSFSDLEQIKEDLPLFFANHPPPLFIDEIQYAPEILRSIKVRIDQERKKMGQYVLTGSQVFPLMKGVSESLAGRAALFELYPLSWKEIDSSTPDYETTLLRMLAGFFPELVTSEVGASRWIDSYLMTYINRDVRLLRPAIQIAQFQRFLRLLAARAV